MPIMANEFVYIDDKGNRYRIVFLTNRADNAIIIKEFVAQWGADI